MGAPPGERSMVPTLFSLFHMTLVFHGVSYDFSYNRCRNLDPLHLIASDISILIPEVARLWT